MFANSIRQGQPLSSDIIFIADDQVSEPLPGLLVRSTLAQLSLTNDSEVPLYHPRSVCLQALRRCCCWSCCCRMGYL
jgi:hypothetical protein